MDDIRNINCSINFAVRTKEMRERDNNALLEAKKQEKRLSQTKKVTIVRKKGLTIATTRGEEGINDYEI